MAKKLDGILIEVNGGVVSYVQLNGNPKRKEKTNATRPFN